MFIINGDFLSKLFVVSEYVRAETNSTGYYWSCIIDELSNSIGKLSVISPELPDSGSENATHLPSFAKPYNKENLVSRLFHQCLQVASLLKLILFRVKSNDLVFSGTNPIILCVILPLAKSLIGFRSVILVHDLYPNNLVAARLMRKSSWSYKILDSIFEYIYKLADHVFAIGRDMRDILVEKGVQRDKITYMPLWVDDKHIEVLKRDDSDFLHANGIVDRVVFQFFGNLGRVQGIASLLEAISLTKSQNSAFLFFGDGRELNLVTQFISDHPEKAVFYLGTVELENRSAVLASCDVALVTLSKNMFGLGVPSKAFFSMAADRPILAAVSIGSELELLVAEHKIGWQCEPEDPQAMASLIDSLCENDRHNLVQSPRTVLKEHFSGRESLVSMSESIKLLFVSDTA